ncbi:MAG: hypothetical protein CSA21_08430 [Deltaproteobacteria bacterium]|nr:MAG: hypothetical protein CSA21_08430 [Deltaproteobacteria bacterium]
MNPHIIQLIKLQGIDLEISTIENKIKDEQNALDSKITALMRKEEHINELTSKIASLETERRGLEADAADRLTQVRESQAKMMQVQTGREQTALLKEIEDGKKSIKEFEEQTVAIMEEVEKLNAQLKEESNLLKGEKVLVEEEKEKVKSSIEKINKGRKTKDTERGKQATLVEPRLLKKYDTLRLRRKGLAVANVLQGVCQGCFMALPPQQYNTLLKGEAILNCPSCQRIIYHQEEESAE